MNENHHGDIFSGVSVILDGNSYVDCTFHNCRIIFFGQASPKMENCNFSACEFAFEGSAGQTVQFLEALAHGASGADAFIVKGILKLDQWAKSNGV